VPVYWAVVKGAPEVVQGFLRAVPDEYEAAYKEYAAQGGRWGHQSLSNKTNSHSTDGCCS
jgi:magnesium-transporting ATPase (P-type)